MRLIDVDKITDRTICDYLGMRHASCLQDIREMLDNQPTIDEKEIIRKAFERVVKRLEESKVKRMFVGGRANGKSVKAGMNYGIVTAIEIVKEEGGIE
jgi:hypothetical protein